MPGETLFPRYGGVRENSRWRHHRVDSYAPAPHRWRGDDTGLTGQQVAHVRGRPAPRRGQLRVQDLRITGGGRTNSDKVRVIYAGLLQSVSMMKYVRELGWSSHGLAMQIATLATGPAILPTQNIGCAGRSGKMIYDRRATDPRAYNIGNPAATAMSTLPTPTSSRAALIGHMCDPPIQPFVFEKPC